MFVKITKSGPRRYVQLVEAYRDSDGRPRQRTVAALSRLDQPGSGLESIVSGLLRVTGAHAAICFIALIMFRIMRARLHAARSPLSPGSALAALSRIQHHCVTVNGAQPLTGLSTINKEQTEILSALTVKIPTLKTQLSLL